MTKSPSMTCSVEEFYEVERIVYRKSLKFFMRPVYDEDYRDTTRFKTLEMAENDIEESRLFDTKRKLKCKYVLKRIVLTKQTVTVSER